LNTRLFNRLQSVRLTNAFLQLELDARTHLADLKPIAQVAPETIEMTLQQEGNFYITRLGDLMIDEEKILLLNLYIDQIPPGTHTIAKVKIPTVLQTNATRLQVGEELSEGDLKKTRIIAKTRLQTDGETTH